MLIIVGSFIVKPIVGINWNDPGESIPAFLTIVLIPMTFSITEGMAFGFISYTVIKVFSSQRKELNPVVFGIAALFLLRYLLFIR